MTTYTGLNAKTGGALTDVEHIRQSITKILITPIGSRIQRREFGSELPNLIDKPLNGITRMRVMAASVMAISQWEPRVELTNVMLEIGTGEKTGALILDFGAVRRDGVASGQKINLLVPLRGV